VQLCTTAVETHVTKMLASVIEDRMRVTMICGTMLSVHTTYPLCGWARSGTSMCGTKPVGGSSIGAGGGGTDLTFPEALPETQWRLHNPGVTSRGRMRPRPGKVGWYGGS
jgi:hypothetical protein